MSSFGNDVAELEAELIKRNREIAKVRDEVLKVARRLEESQMRNNGLLNKVSELDSEVTRLKSALADKSPRKTSAAEAAGKEREASVGLEKRVAELEAEVASLQKEFDEERHKHVDTQALLAQAESSSRDFGGRNVEMRRQIQDLQAELQQKQGLSVEQSQKLEEEKAHADLQLDGLRTELVEHRRVRLDLEEQARTHHQALGSVRDQLDSAKAEVKRHVQDRKLLEQAQEEVARELQEHQARQEELLVAERARHEEHLKCATQQAADLDRRFAGQRMLLDAAQDALLQSEASKEQVAAGLKAELEALRGEHSTAKALLAQEREQAQSGAAALGQRHTSELQAAEEVLRHRAQAELEAARHAESEAEERQGPLESRCESLAKEQEEIQTHHGRQQEALQGQQRDLQDRLTKAEERLLAEQLERETLKKELEEAKQQLTRAAQADQLEASGGGSPRASCDDERLQQMMEAKGQPQSAAEKIAASKLKEKETLLQHRDLDEISFMSADSALERMTVDLEAARRKAAELENLGDKVKEEAERERHTLAVRQAQLDGELKHSQEYVTELESRLDAQRENMEQFSDTLSKAQTDREALLEAKGSLEARLRQRAAEQASLQQTHDEAARRCAELEQELAKEQETHRHAVQELKQSLSDRGRSSDESQGALESELLVVRQHYEALMRNTAELQSEVGEQQERRGELQAALQVQRAECERVTAQLEQATDARAALERELGQARAAGLESEALARRLGEEIRAAAEERVSEQVADAQAKVQVLEERLAEEQRAREDAEAAVQRARHAAEDAVREQQQTQRHSEQELKAEADSFRDRAEDLQAQLALARDQAEDIDQQRREAEAQLRERVREQVADAQAKVQVLEERLAEERRAREDAETAVQRERHAAEDAVREQQQTHERSERELKAEADSLRDRAEDLQAQLALMRDQAEAQRSRAEDIDQQRREAEAQLRGEVAAVEARLRRAETEKQHGQGAAEDGKASLAQLQAAMDANPEVAGLERELLAEPDAAAKAREAKLAAEGSASSKLQDQLQLRERLGMAADELLTRQVEFVLDKQRLSGALEESRRTLQSYSFGVPIAGTAADSARAAGLEKALAEERLKSVEQAVALQRSEHELEDAQRRGEEQRTVAVQGAREVERQCVALAEELHRTKTQAALLEQRSTQELEVRRMAAEELLTVRNDSKYELTRTLEELRYMKRKQAASASSRPSLTPGSSKPSLTGLMGSAVSPAPPPRPVVVQFPVTAWSLGAF